jgi:hypothetical protein
MSSLVPSASPATDLCRPTWRQVDLEVQADLQAARKLRSEILQAVEIDLQNAKLADPATPKHPDWLCREFYISNDLHNARVDNNPVGYDIRYFKLVQLEATRKRRRAHSEIDQLYRWSSLVGYVICKMKKLCGKLIYQPAMYASIQ